MIPTISVNLGSTMTNTISNTKATTLCLISVRKGNKPCFITTLTSESIVFPKSAL